MKGNVLISNIAVMVALLTAACTNSAAPQNAGQSHTPAKASKIQRTFIFECSSTFSFIAAIEDDTAWLFLPQKTRSLPRVLSANGEKFSDNQYTFWINSDKAMLETATSTHRNCSNNRSKAIWEHAKLNGVDFRAVGNEPGWHLEIRYQDRILFVGDYGNFSREFPAPEPLTNKQARRTIYQTAADGKSLMVIIEGRQCRDTMKGELFETTVSVMFERKTYLGCGRPLH